MLPEAPHKGVIRMLTNKAPLADENHVRNATTGDLQPGRHLALPSPGHSLLTVNCEILILDCCFQSVTALAGCCS